MTEDTLLQTLAAALISNDTERLEQSAELIAASNKFDLAPGILQRLDIPLNSTPADQLLSIYESPETLDIWPLLDSLPAEYHALILEAGLDSDEIELDRAATTALALSDTSIGKPCLLLRLAQKTQQIEYVEAALDLLELSPQYPSRLTVSRHGNCRPETFVPEQASLPNSSSYALPSPELAIEYEIPRLRAPSKRLKHSNPRI